MTEKYIASHKAAELLRLEELLKLLVRTSRPQRIALQLESPFNQRDTGLSFSDFGYLIELGLIERIP